ncbi:VOC family protein [Pelomonas sp. SE-A7]|uniref:VOC family protein n=1 Tax=Pelomonas sp. SE-A7 TaxID=3054953 RepID=UPI00259CDB24|nr:VOC family protein [Pelomonas sp. SE-A7]MDM4766518.1 VOC family protein [Pelomonas sp. SE-A7]
MKPTPADWPRLSSSLFYENANEAIAWLMEAFGFELRIKVDAEDGSVLHSELTYGEAVIMVSEGGAERAARFGTPLHSPKVLGGANTQSVMLYVDDVDAHCERARSCGATITAEPVLCDYGPEYWADRSYGALDCDGHLWWFSQRIRG